MRRRLHPLAIALAALVCAIATTPAHAAWSEPQTLAVPAAEQLAATGNAKRSELFAWKVTTRRRVRTRTQTGLASFVRARLRLADGSLGVARAISATREPVANPAVALDAAGNATVVWSQAGRTVRIMGAHRRSGASFGRPFEIGRTTAFNSARPALAVAPDGALVLVWNSGRRIQIARRAPGRCASGRPRGCFGEPQPFVRGADHAIAMSRGGSAFVVWAAAVPRGDAIGSALRLAIAPRGGLFGPARAIASPGDASQPAIAIAPAGDAVIAWRAALPAGGEQNADAPILASIRAAAGSISAPQVVSTFPGSNPQVRTNPRGEAIMAWNQRNPSAQNPDGPEVAASMRPVGGAAFATPIRLSPAGVAAGSASLAVDAAGNAIAVYSAALTGQYASSPLAVAQRKPPGAAFGAPELLRADFTGAIVFSAGSRVTAASGGSGGRTLISDYAG